MTVVKTLVEQEWKSSQEVVNTPSFQRILDRVTHKAHPETRQSIMIPVRSSIRYSKWANLSSNYLLRLVLSLSGEDEPSETKMTRVTKLFPWKIVILEEAQKLAVIHRTSTREYRFGQRTLHQTGFRSSIVFGWRKLGICFSGIGLNHSVQFQKVDGQECEIIAEILKSK